MNNKLYDALENCLQNLEQGQDLNSVLARYPKLAKQLRPMLETSIRARTSNEHTIQRDIQRRGRVRVLQYAAEMREAKRARRRVIPMFSRWAITVGVVGSLFLGSTGLVSASSATLPGDQLYLVKRTWEDVRLLFVFNPQGRDVLTSEYEQERLNEIDELLTRGRSASITFSGLITDQQNGQWMVSGIPVAVTGLTRLPANVISTGVPVTVLGTTRSDGTVDAQEIRLLQPGVFLPPLEPSGDNDQNGETDNENHRTQIAPANENNNSSSQATPMPVIVNVPGTPVAVLPSLSQQDHKGYEFSGVVEAMQGNMWNINGQLVLVDQAQVNGTVGVGSLVKFEGYYNVDGQFVATKVEIKSIDNGSNVGTSNGGGSSGSSGSDSGGNDNHNDNGDNYHENNNTNTNTNYNYNYNTNTRTEDGH